MIAELRRFATSSADQNRTLTHEEIIAAFATDITKNLKSLVERDADADGSVSEEEYLPA